MKKFVSVFIFLFVINGLISPSFAIRATSDDIGDLFNISQQSGASNRYNDGSDFSNIFIKIGFLILFLAVFLLIIYLFKKGLKLSTWILIILIIIFSLLSLQVIAKRSNQARKPVIYFYPPKEQVIDVRLQYLGELTVTYPKYDPKISGWKIRAYPDGRIVNLSDQEEYSYIFWEGIDSRMEYDFSKGFIVEGDKADIFLKETLSKMGLIPREYNEFIVYWYPVLKKNKYNLVYFAHQEYEKIASLEIVPKPDSLLRVYMVSKPLIERIEIEPQEIEPFIRNGFTVVEWGGTELNK